MNSKNCVISKQEETERLLIEYKELCQDWRMRDKYVLDKLGIASILFALLGFAMATIPEEKYLIRLLLLSLGAFLSFILCISIFKDIYYRDSTETLLECLGEYLCIKGSLLKMGCQKEFEDDLKFPRKVRLKTSPTRFPRILEKIFRNRHTFKWVFYFYFIVFVVFSLYISYCVLELLL